MSTREAPRRSPDPNGEGDQGAPLDGVDAVKSGTEATRRGDRHPLWQLADELQQDLRAAQSHLVALRAHLAALELAEPRQRMTCPDCGITATGPRALSEHRYHSHDGPEPAHWVDLERRIADDGDLAALSTEELISRAAVDPWGNAEARELRRRREAATG